MKCLLLLYTKTNHFLIWQWCMMKNWFCMTTSSKQFSDWTDKKLQSASQSKIAPKKRVMVSVSWPAAGLIHYSFLWSWWNHYIWEVCLRNRRDAPKTSMPVANIVQQKLPNSSPWYRLTAHETTNASKVKWIGPQSFASSAIFTWPLTNWLPLLQSSQQLFAEKRLLQPAGHRRCIPRVPQIPKQRFLLQEWINLFLVGKKKKKKKKKKMCLGLVIKI